MGLFDSLEAAAGQFIGGEAHQALSGALASTPLGNVSGLLDTLQQGGLGEAVQSWTQGGNPLPVSADRLKGVLDDSHVQQLAASLGVSPDAALSTLAQHLPGLAAANAAQ